MVHWNADRVVGGIEQPRFLVVGPELSPNISFEESLTGVTGSPASRVFDSTSPFLDYVLKVEDDSAAAAEYAEITIPAGETIAGKRYVIFAYARSDSEIQQACYFNFPGLSDTHEKQLVLDSQWRRKIVHEVVVPDDASGSDLVYRIYPAAKAGGVSNTGAIRIDDFHCRKVLAEHTMPLPDRGEQTEIFRLVKQAEHELVNGAVKTYKKGFRYYYEAGYERLAAAYEIIRSQIATTDYEILFFPHKDSWLCYLVKWADDLERSWAYGTAAHGHQAEVQLMSQEIMHIIPTEIFDVLNQYTYPEDSVMVEGSSEVLVVKV